MAEIDAQVPIDRLRTLLSPHHDEVDLSGDAMQLLRSIFDVQVIVRMRSGDFVVKEKDRHHRKHVLESQGWTADEAVWRRWAQGDRRSKA